MNKKINVLILEDDTYDRDLLLRYLTKAGFDFNAEIVETAEHFETALTTFAPDIILSDYSLPAYTGPEAFAYKQKVAPHVPFILISGVLGEERAVELIKNGVTDFVIKGKFYALIPKIERALKEAEDRIEKLKAEQKLKESEVHLLRAQSIAHLGSWELDFATGTAIWSAETCRIYGLSPAENKQSFDTFLSFVHPLDLEAVKNHVAKGQTTLCDYSFYHRILRKDGVVRYIYSEAVFVFDAEGKPIVLHGIAQDVTERKETEEKLFESEQRLKEVFDNTSESIYSIDRNYQLVWFNKAFADNFRKLFNKEPEPGENRPLPLQQQLINSANTNADRALRGEHFTEEQEFKFGSQKYWFAVRHSPIFKNGQITGVAFFTSDITKQKQAEILLRKSFEDLQLAAEKQSAILNTLPANIALLDGEGTIVKVNEAWKKFGFDNGLNHGNACVGENYIKISEEAFGDDAATGKKMAEALKEIISGRREKFSIEYPCDAPYQKRWFRCEVRALDGDEKLGAVVMHIDVTDRNLAEAEVKILNSDLEQKIAQRTADLEKANKEMEAFSYTVSHDLRSPLQVINGYSSILQKNYQDVLNDDARILLKGIKDNTTHMAQLINDLLNFSHLGRAELKRRELNMTEIVNVVITELKAGDSCIKAEVKVNHLLPAFADAGLVHQVWVNLISNAMKYSGKNSIPVIEIGMKQINGEEVYYVKDNGVGFDMMYYDKLFTVFHRLHKPSEFEGTGVGLALVHSVVEKHGGRVWAEAKVNEGATFYFTLSQNNRN